MDQSKMIDKTRQKLAGVTTRTTFVCVCVTHGQQTDTGDPDQTTQGKNIKSSSQTKSERDNVRKQRFVGQRI